MQALTRGYVDGGHFGDGNFGPPSAEEVSRLNALEEQINDVSGGAE